VKKREGEQLRRKVGLVAAGFLRDKNHYNHPYVVNRCFIFWFFLKHAHRALSFDFISFLLLNHPFLRDARWS